MVCLTLLNLVSGRGNASAIAGGAGSLIHRVQIGDHVLPMVSLGRLMNISYRE